MCLNGAFSTVYEEITWMYRPTWYHIESIEIRWSVSKICCSCWQCLHQVISWMFSGDSTCCFLTKLCSRCWEFVKDQLSIQLSLCCRNLSHTLKHHVCLLQVCPRQLAPLRTRLERTTGPKNHWTVHLLWLLHRLTHRCAQIHLCFHSHFSISVFCTPLPAQGLSCHEMYS